MSIGRWPGRVPKPITLARPAVLLTMVSSLAPWSLSALIRFWGVPPGPAKPSIIKCAPLGMSATASAKEGKILSIAI